jgi:hypothetical protein
VKVYLSFPKTKGAGWQSMNKFNSITASLSQNPRASQ